MCFYIKFGAGKSFDDMIVSTLREKKLMYLYPRLSYRIFSVLGVKGSSPTAFRFYLQGRMA